MGILELSRRYYFETADPLLKREFPQLYPRLAVGLAGNGSECFSFDDEYSIDHDCGGDFYIWTLEEDREAFPALEAWKAWLFANHPPCVMEQRSVYRLPPAVMTAGDFYTQLIGVAHTPRTIGEWTRAPEENFAMATNGEVWFDCTGEFTQIRNDLLLYYPEDIRRKRMAAACMEIAQTGQYNHMRMGRRGDMVAVRLTLARFCEAVISLIFMLNRVYKPYYKWAYRRLCALPILGKELAEPLRRIALFSIFGKHELNEQQRELDALCALLIAEILRQDLAQTDELFMTAQGEEIQRGIKTESLRNLPAEYKI